MRGGLALSDLGLIAALAYAAAPAGCGPAAGGRPSGEAAPPGALAGPAAQTSPSPCSPAIRGAIPGAAPRHPPRAHLLECAVAAARTVEPAGARAMVVDRIAAGFAAAEDFHRAVEVACELAPDAGRRALILRDVGRSLARSGRADDAARLADAIAQAPRDDPSPPGPAAPTQLPPADPFDTSDVWLAIATEQARAGDVPGALAGIRRIRGPSASTAQLAVVDALLARGQAAEARTLLDEVAQRVASSAMTHPEALAGAAVRYAVVGQQERGAALLRGGIRELEGQGKWARGSRDQLAEALGRIGLHREAIELLARNGQAQARVVAELVKAGQLDPARAAAEAITEGTWRAQALAALAQKHAALGDARRAEASWQAARDAALSVAGPRFKVEALAEVALTLANARRPTEAERMLSEAADLAASIQDRTEKELALREAAVAHAKIGRCVRALEIAMSAGDSGYAIREVAASCADAGDYDQISARIEDIRYADSRGQALGDLAVKYAEAGQLDRALAEVGRIEGREERARALAALGTAALPGGASAVPRCPAGR